MGRFKLIKSNATVEEYFAMDEASSERLMLLGGEILVVSGGTDEHSAIATNVIFELGSRLRGTRFRVRDASLRIKYGRRSEYGYADVVVYSGTGEFERNRENQKTALRSPLLVVEVLSDDTAAFDRGDKRRCYAENSSFCEYILIEQVRPQIDVSVRRLDGSWLQKTISGLDGTLLLEALSIEIPLAAIYRDVEFPPVPPGQFIVALPE